MKKEKKNLGVGIAQFGTLLLGSDGFNLCGKVHVKTSLVNGKIYRSELLTLTGVYYLFVDLKICGNAPMQKSRLLAYFQIFLCRGILPQFSDFSCIS